MPLTVPYKKPIATKPILHKKQVAFAHSSPSSSTNGNKLLYFIVSSVKF